MDNSTSTNNGNGNDGNDNGVVNWVALVVSLVALLGTMAQVLQQYIASATGYANCDETVMGKWHESKKRRFRATELRFEVQFETPVIFVCPANNDKGPIKDKDIHYVDGTSESLKKTRALLRQEEQEAQRQTLQDSGVHTADNERASWVMLLSELQSMERESQEWQQEQYKRGPPQSFKPLDFQSRTLAVALQAKKRSWDTMPSSVKKPYATTAMCHLLEIAAMMGIYWKEFDRSRDRYRAEGNGYILTGTNMPDLGVMFTLQICGKSKFQENRVIPVDEVKELCCGFVSTLFQEDAKDRRRIFPNEDPKDLTLLRLASMDEIAETMVLIECNTDTANYFRSSNTKHGHLFPIPFELLGMLGKTLHIRDTSFRMLPNPTPYHWDKNFFNLRKLVKEYWKKISDTDADLPPTPQISQLAREVENLVAILELDKESATPGYSMMLLNTLHDVIDMCDDFLRRSNRDLIQMVLREHFQEVLKLINDKSGADGDMGSKMAHNANIKKRAVHFGQLTSASPETRQEAFMDLYFFKVLGEVKTRAVTSYERRKSTQYAPSMHSRAPSIDSIQETKGVSASPSPSATTSRPISPGIPLGHSKKHDSQHSVPKLQIHPPERVPSQTLSQDITTSLESKASEVWCTLVLRMLCWLLLHDFNKKDVQIAKSELLGSRLPVYIA
ncbi:hypothetical protein NEMBOFW57_007979 [Staphylotrichum longicolle]|uniref:Modin n=1 Tax=Staphylotrichum longicolle TaxID=669026 RepID=A0AAD4EQH1_9PEZI|nr:hypothetical protein NEMBOFW57_007979 [Staphylotrichum longicolle]